MANGMRPTCICQTKVFLWVRGVSVSDLQNIHKSQALSLLISGQAWATLRLILYFSAVILLIAFLMFIPAVAQLDGVVSDHWWSDCLDIPHPTAHIATLRNSPTLVQLCVYIIPGLFCCIFGNPLKLCDI